MKQPFLQCASLLALACATQGQVAILTGPVTNRANNHAYYLLSASTWTDAEAQAVQLGGHLVTINDSTESAWVFNMFGKYDGIDRELWLGLNDAAAEGTFVWSSGDPVNYTKWYPGDPNNWNGIENYVAIWAPVTDRQGRWVDFANIAADDQGKPICGVVEIALSGQPTPPPLPSVIAGPITNTANGHAYYLLSGAAWTDAEAKSIQLGGHLVTINDEAENNWVFKTFARYGGLDRELWIGLNDAATEGTFVWSSSEPVSYLRWYPGEPNNWHGVENYATIWAPITDSAGRWADFANIAADDQGKPICGVVEITLSGPPQPEPVATATPSDSQYVWITEIHRTAEGHALLHIKGLSGRSHKIEVSTDMLHWVEIGEAVFSGGRDYMFEDSQATASDASARFYRIVAPK